MNNIKKIFLIFVLLVVTIMLIYKPLMIRITVRRYLTNNNIMDYHTVNIEKYPAQDGYLVELKNDLNDSRNLTIISERMPIDVIHDSGIDKEDMKWLKKFLYFYPH